jgi:hypothetical protein
VRDSALHSAPLAGNRRYLSAADWLYGRSVGAVPNELRSAIEDQLSRLVRGDLPEMLTWVRNYGQDGAVLIEQPADIWDHRYTDAARTIDGGWHVVVPLWTEQESPSDLSAEIIVTASGAARIHDVHVL